MKTFIIGLLVASAYILVVWLLLSGAQAGSFTPVR